MLSPARHRRDVTREDADLFPFRSGSVRIEVMNKKTRTTARRWIFAGFLVFASCGLSNAQSVEEAYVAFMGDAGSGNRPQARVRDRLLDRSRNGLLDYVFTIGDNVYESGDADEIDEKYFFVYARLLLEGVRFHSALGNHDVEDCYASGARPLPRDSSAYVGCDVAAQLDPANWFGYVDQARYYSVRSGEDPALFEVFVLDSNTLPTGQSKLDEDENDTAQVEWLRGALAASSAQWKIVVTHHPMHTPTAASWFLNPFSFFTGHDRDEGLDFLEPIFVEYGVDVVFQGHNHFYARLEPRQGVRYFVSGGGGKDTYKFDSEPGYVVDREDQGDFNHFVHVRMTRDRFEYCVVDDSGTVRAAGSFAKGDDSDTLVGRGQCSFGPGR